MESGIPQAKKRRSRFRLSQSHGQSTSSVRTSKRGTTIPDHRAGTARGGITHSTGVSDAPTGQHDALMGIDSGTQTTGLELPIYEAPVPVRGEPESRVEDSLQMDRNGRVASPRLGVVSGTPTFGAYGCVSVEGHLIERDARGGQTDRPLGNILGKSQDRGRNCEAEDHVEVDLNDGRTVDGVSGESAHSGGTSELRTRDHVEMNARGQYASRFMGGVRGTKSPEGRETESGVEGLCEMDVNNGHALGSGRGTLMNETHELHAEDMLEGRGNRCWGGVSGTMTVEREDFESGVEQLAQRDLDNEGLLGRLRRANEDVQDSAWEAGDIDAMDLGGEQTIRQLGDIRGTHEAGDEVLESGVAGPTVERRRQGNVRRGSRGGNAPHSVDVLGNCDGGLLSGECQPPLDRCNELLLNRTVDEGDEASRARQGVRGPHDEEGTGHDACNGGNEGEVTGGGTTVTTPGGSTSEASVAVAEDTCAREPLSPGHSSGGDAEVAPRIGNWRVLWGLLLTNGSLKLTKTQYQAMRIIADTFRRMGTENVQIEAEICSPSNLPRQRIEALPHYSTLYKRFKPILYDKLSVQSVQHMEAMSIRKAGARAKSYAEDGTPLVPVQIILPSEYARADVGCDPVFRLMRSTSFEESTHQDACVDSWPLISARSWFYGTRKHFNVDGDVRGSSGDFAEPGDIINISFLGSTDLETELSADFGVSGSRASPTTVSGQVLHVWTAHHNIRRGDAMFVDPIPTTCSNRDKSIIKCLQFCSYSSPSDMVAVDVPALPVEDEDSGSEEDRTRNVSERAKRKRVSPQMREAIRLRNQALQQHRQEMEDAWIGWKKPLLKPGDVVALIRPPPSRCSSDSRILLVHRFWTEEDERSRHIFWLRAQDSITVMPQSPTPLRGFTPLTRSSTKLYRDVRNVLLESKGSERRGVDKQEPVSSLGILSSGERYFIYRFLLFWDGFEITAGKSASGEGFYLVCLNLPVQARASAAAVRIISLTPPGVKSEAVFRRIHSDIVNGMTEGIADIGGDGKPIRIFLDLVGFIGDTPAINSALDVLGHTSAACCHLCRFIRRSSTVLGSRYTRQGFHASSTAMARGFYQHAGIRDAGAKKETCRLLGISQMTPAEQLPIHKLCEAMFSARESIPNDINGRPILSGQLDPYRSCLVAPDHLLTGHFRDCVNASFRLLPTKQHKHAAEVYMMGFLHECRLPTQNRLFDFDKKSLYSMSMTELYALSVMAHTAFVRSCVSLPALSNRLTPICWKCIEVVGSCCALIARLWNPNDSEQGAGMSITFIRSVQEQTSNHMDLVRALCEMDDNSMAALENPRTNNNRKSELSKEYRERMVAIKAIDKPNVHRLHELAFSTLPMVGFVSRVGELVLEKAHQTLKRAIKQSNNKDVQIQSVLSAVFADWQGRLTMQIDGALRNDFYSILGCFRLLAGRDAILKTKGSLSDSHRAMLRSAIGPECCVPMLLKTQSKSVVSPRGEMDQSVTWLLENELEIADTPTSISNEQRKRSYLSFMDASQTPDCNPKVCFGNLMRCTLSNGLLHTFVKIGDVIQTSCNDYRGVIALFTTKSTAGLNVFWAAVHKCVSQAQEPEVEASKYRHRTYVFAQGIHFIVLHQSVQTVAIIPTCLENSCGSALASGKISHSSTCNPWTGSSFFLLAKQDGFPPRTG